MSTSQDVIDYFKTSEALYESFQHLTGLASHARMASKLAEMADEKTTSRMMRHTAHAAASEAHSLAHEYHQEHGIKPSMDHAAAAAHHADMAHKIANEE